MNGSQQKKRVIPLAIWIVAAAVFVIGFEVMTELAIPSDPKSVNWPEGGKILLGIVVPLLCAVYILLIGFIYGDAKRRGMRYVMWTLLAIFIPDAIGIILYFLLRDPLPVICAGCGKSISSKFTFCPNCSSPLRPTCTECGRGLEAEWKHCPNCGAAAPAANPLPRAGAH